MRHRLASSGIDPAILLEAADWLVLLQSGEAGEADRAALARWRERSAAHEAAWQRAENLPHAFDQVPPRIGHETLARLERPGRRRALRLGLVLLATPAGWLAWRHVPWWSAELRTAVGEQRTTELADGTRVVLNTASTVRVVFTAAERHLTLLSGEILVTTGRDTAPLPRPFIVSTRHGSLRPLGTRFLVRRLEAGTHVAVFEGAVEARPGHAPASLVHAGEQMTFTAELTQPLQPADVHAALWERGMLLARDMRLGDLVAELARYHPAPLRCDLAVADLPVSGAFPLADIPASLALLEKTLPLRVVRSDPREIVLRRR